MKVLVTGGTGFVGSHAVRALAAAGHEVRLLARSREKVARVLGAGFGDVVVGDMGDVDAVGRALGGCDAVLHAAATVTVGRAEEVLAANATGSRLVLGGAVERGLDPVIAVSSIAALEPRGGLLSADDPVARPKRGYARSKAEAERYARSLQADGAPVVIVYPSGVYGPDDPGLGDPAKGLRDRLRYGWPISTGGSTCVDVRDLARLFVAVAEPGRGPRRFMAGGHFLPWAEEADLCESLIGRRVRRIPLPPLLARGVGRAVDFVKWVHPAFDYPLTHEAALILAQAIPCDSTPAAKELGIAFRPMEETLRDAIAWLVAAGHLDARYAPKLAPASATPPGR